MSQDGAEWARRQIEHEYRNGRGIIESAERGVSFAPKYPTKYELGFGSRYVPERVGSMLGNKRWCEMWNVLQCMRNVRTGSLDFDPMNLIFGFAALCAHNKDTNQPCMYFIEAAEDRLVHGLEIVTGSNETRVFGYMWSVIDPDSRIFLPERWVRRIFALYRRFPKMRKASWKPLRTRDMKTLATHGLYVDVGTAEVEDWKLVNSELSPVLTEADIAIMSCINKA